MMKVNEEELRKEYIDNEKTQKECAEFFGVSQRTIFNRMVKYGIEARHERNDAWKRRISKRLRGNKNAEGVEFTEERRQKISENSSKALRKKIKKEGYSWGHTGHKHTEETKEALRDSQIEKLQNKFYLGKMTKLEKKGYEKLDRAGITYEPQKKIDFYLVDAYIPETNTIVEFQGDYWHSRDDIKAKDKQKFEFLTSRGYNVVEVWESEMDSWNPEELYS